MNNPTRHTQPDPAALGSKPALLDPGKFDEDMETPQKLSPETRRVLIIVGLVLVLGLVLIIAGAIFLFRAPASTTARFRDVSIIFMAFASIVTLFVLVLLIVQLARLVNLLQNEIGPILASLNVTISNLRGTTLFLSENLTEPVIKFNEYVAGLSQLFYVLGLSRKPPKSNTPKGE